MKKDLLFLAVFGLALALVVNILSGCAVHTARPVVSSTMLGTSDGVTANGEAVFDRQVQCPSDGDCDVELVVPITDTTTVKVPAQKRGCLGAMALGGLAGTAGGAAYGSIRYPNDVEVSASRVDVWFDATWKFAAAGAGASALVTGIICYATR